MAGLPTNKWLFIERGSAFYTSKASSSKLGSFLKEAVVKKLAQDPSTSTCDISKGQALGFCPISVSLAAANKKTIEKLVHSQRIDFSGDNSKLTVSNFDKLVKEKIDILESQVAEDSVMHQKVLDMTTPYMRYEFKEFSHRFTFIICFLYSF